MARQSEIGSDLCETLQSYLADCVYFRSIALEMRKDKQAADFDSKAAGLLELGERLKASGVITAHAFKFIFKEEERRQELKGVLHPV